LSQEQIDASERDGFVFPIDVLSHEEAQSHRRELEAWEAQRGALIDSPGFQGFGLLHLSREEIERGFPEFSVHREHCRFYNCTHQHEPNCGVLAAIARKEINPARHALYLRLIQAKDDHESY
jgi:ribosome small subunit-dependent GTPase A